MTTFAAARVVVGDGALSATPAWVTIDGDRIVATGTGAPPPGALDLGEALLAPGFVDLQVNGTGAVDFLDAAADQLLRTVDDLAAGGCTALLPTLVSAPLDAYEPVLQRMAALRAARPGVLGVHLEGPFLGGAPGAHPSELLRAADVDWLAGVCERFGDLVRVVTLAPEADPDHAATRMLAARGVTVALGHSTASYEDAGRAADAGATMVTHVFNGMGALHHRAPGLPGAALDDRRLVPTVIADLVHVHPAVVRLVAAARADAVAVTDAVGGAFDVRDGAAWLDDGTLAGSTVTMDAVVRNLVGMGLPLGQAVRMATGNAARALGIRDRGRVAPGCVADLVALDPSTLVVRRVWRAGAEVGRAR